MEPRPARASTCPPCPNPCQQTVRVMIIDGSYTKSNWHIVDIFASPIVELYELLACFQAAPHEATWMLFMQDRRRSTYAETSELLVIWACLKESKTNKRIRYTYIYTTFLLIFVLRQLVYMSRTLISFFFFFCNFPWFENTSWPLSRKYIVWKLTVYIN